MKIVLFILGLTLNIGSINAAPDMSDYYDVCRDSTNVVEKGAQAAGTGIHLLIDRLVDRKNTWGTFFDECDQAELLFIKSFGQLYDSARTGTKHDVSRKKHNIRNTYIDEWDDAKKQAMNKAYKNLGVSLSTFKVLQKALIEKAMEGELAYHLG